MDPVAAPLCRRDGSNGDRAPLLQQPSYIAQNNPAAAKALGDNLLDAAQIKFNATLPQ
jgi:hypothetical protein